MSADIAAAVAPGPLLRVAGLRVGYRTIGRSVTAVDGIDFHVGSGETVALVGESGSGKTTAAHAIIGLLPPEGSVTAGEIVLDGQDVAGLSERRLRHLRGSVVSLVPQDPTVSLNPVHRIGDQIAEVLRIHRLANRRAGRALAVELLDSVGIDAPRTRAAQYPHELSGGMRQRVLIAIALAANPRLIIADEPTSALDVTVQQVVLDSLSALTAERGTAVLLITHDLGVALDRADRVVVMHQGRIVEQGAATAVVGHPQHDYTRRLVAAAPSLAGGRRNPSPGLVAATRQPDDPSSDEIASTAVLRVEQVSKVFRVAVPGAGRADLVAVDDVSFAVRRGSTFALVGESGSGKSTTARLVSRAERPSSGRIWFDGDDVASLRGSELRRLRSRIQVVYQNPYASLDPRFTVGEIIDEPLRTFEVGDRAERRRRVGSILDHVALSSGLLDRRPAELSGGQRQRVAIARALVVRPELIVLDEPVSALDVSVQAQVLQLLTDLQAEFTLTYLLISHDLAVIRQVADEVAVMNAGRIVEHGDVEQVFSHPAHEVTRALLAAIPGARRAPAGDDAGVADLAATHPSTHPPTRSTTHQP